MSIAYVIEQGNVVWTDMELEEMYESSGYKEVDELEAEYEKVQEQEMATYGYTFDKWTMEG